MSGHLNLELGRPRYRVDFFQPSRDNPDIFLKKTLSKEDTVAIGDHNFRHLTFKIDTIEDMVMTCFLRFQVNGPEFVPFILRSCGSFRDYTGYDSLIFGLLYGIMLGMVLYNFFLFATLGSKIYFQYVLQIGFFLLYCSIFLGHLVPWLKLDIETALVLEYSFLGGCIFWGVVFCRNFFDMNLISPFWNTLLYLMQILSGCIIFAGILKNYFMADLLSSLAGLSPIVILIIGIIQWRKGFKPAGFYIFANLFFIFGTAIFILWNLGLFPRDIPGEIIFTLGPVVESVLLSFSLAYKIRILEEDRLSLAQSSAMYKHASQIDGMTGLYNKQYLFDSLTHEINGAKQTGNPLSLIIMDVDNFKNFNDTFGHPEGDVVLKALAGVITALVRDFDYACRYGGEEFVIILPNADNDDAFQVAERIRKKFSSLEFSPVKDSCVIVTISVGVALYKEEEHFDPLIKRADKALYMAKKHGKNRTRIAN